MDEKQFQEIIERLDNLNKKSELILEGFEMLDNSLEKIKNGLNLILLVNARKNEKKPIKLARPIVGG